MSLDNSALTGASTPDATPSAPAGSTQMESVDPQHEGFNMPLEQPSAPAPASTPAPASGNGGSGSDNVRPWRRILAGALYGLAGVDASGPHGRPSFASGLVEGVAGTINSEQRQFANTAAAKQLQFESVKAADSHTLALKSAQLSDLQIADAQQALSLNALKYNAVMSALGFTPAATVSGSTPQEIHNSAVGTLPTLAAQNGGKIPGVATVNDPAGAGDDPDTHIVHVYSPSSLDVMRNPNGTRELIDAVRLMNSQSQTSNAEWASGYGKGGEIAGVPNVIAGRQKELLDAQQQLTVPVPAVDANRAKMDAANAATATTLTNQLNSYKRNGSKAAPNYDSIVSYLQNRVETFKVQAAGVSQIQAQTEQSDAQARRQGELDAQNSPSNQAAAARGEQLKTEARNKANISNPSNMFVGSLPDGTQVAGTGDELQRAGAAGITKLPASEASKTIVARQLISPGGLFANVNQDIRTLDQQGKLGVAASRWNDFLAGKVGSEPEFAKLRTDMGLLGTALMQAHVGARGSAEMLEHFQSLADYRISDGPTLRAALSREYSYMREKSMLPRQPLPAPAQPQQTVVGGQ